MVPARWMIVALFVIAGLSTVLGLRERSRADELGALAHLREAEQLRGAGLLVAEQLKAGELNKQLGQLLAQNAPLRQQVEDLKQRLEKAEIALVARLSTGPVKVGAEETPKPRFISPETGPLAQSGASLSPCYLGPGDMGEVRVSLAVVRAEHGTLVAAGGAQCWRVAPGPPTMLFSGKFDTKSSYLAEPAPPASLPEPGWGGGLWLGLGPGGWSAGPAVIVPPLKLFGWEVNLVAGGGVGPSGTWSAGGAVLVR